LINNIVFIIAVLFVFWFLWNCRRLPDEEAETIARKKRLAVIEQHYGFPSGPSYADYRSFKRIMKADGNLYEMDILTADFPKEGAAILKHKKHEWIMYAFCRGKKVVSVWMNKGPDRTQVWSLIPIETLYRIAGEIGADTVISMHNHPNPDPGRYSSCMPSEADGSNAISRGMFFNQQNINFLAFVAERGLHYQYACWVTDGFFPLEDIRSEIDDRRRRFSPANLRLRREGRVQGRLYRLLQDRNANDNIRRNKITEPLRPPALVSPRDPVKTQATTSATKTLPPPPTKVSVKPLPSPVGSDVSERAYSSIHRVPVISSHIAAIGYDKTTMALEVVFKNSGVYRYHGVPPSMFEEMLKAQSKGRFLNGIVRAGYKYTRMKNI
jgi:hypothetical protein